MRYITGVFLMFFSAVPGIAQDAVDTFLNGKAVVLISAAPAARPIMSWEAIAEEIHPALVEAGGDPVAYYELEDIIISEGTQASYATAFLQRMIKNIVILTRKENGESSIYIMPFTQDKKIIAPGSAWTSSGKNLAELKESVGSIGVNRRTQNLLVLEVPEYPQGPGTVEAAQAAEVFLARNPLNLDVFQLGVRSAGAAGDAGYLTTFRYDLLGKTTEQILAEQESERQGLEGIFKAHYPYNVAYLTTPKADAELIKERVQFVLMRMEGREGDLMQRMGLEVPDTIDKDRIVIKYYIKFLVRNELYIGTIWDADPHWDVALANFLQNIQQ